MKIKVDRLEQPNETKGTTEERPLDCPCSFKRNCCCENYTFSRIKS